MDLDLNIALYELLPNGDYLAALRAALRVARKLRPGSRASPSAQGGERQQLTFKSERLTSRRLQAGSRLVMVLGINKRPDHEINYGTGGDVSAESVADAAGAAEGPLVQQQLCRYPGAAIGAAAPASRHP